MRPEIRELEKGEYQTYKLRNTPTDPDSPTYALAVPYFSSGCVEEWLKFRRNLTKVLTGQNVTTGPAQYSVARRLLDGDALAAFNNSTTVAGHTETTVTFQSGLNEVARQVFPPRSVQLQKRYMRRFVRKPATMKTREYAARIVEINNYLPSFPPSTVGGAVPTKLDDDELVDLMEFGIPRTWQRAMVLQDFDPTDASIQDFIAFCERMERVELADGGHSTSNNNNKSGNRENGSSPEKTPRSTKRFRSRDDDEGDQECLLHGKGGHSSHECRTLKAQARRMNNTFGAQHPSKKKEYKDKQELHAIIAESVERALKKKKRKAPSKKDKVSEDLQNLENISISDDSSTASSSSSD